MQGIGHLQEVIVGASATGRDGTLILGNRAEDAELGVKIFADVHDRSNIAAAIAVVRSRPNSDNGLLGEVILCELA